MKPNNKSSFMLCPTCGTKLPENATRCPVCGRTFTAKSAPKESKAIRSQRLPELTLSLPLALGLLLVILAIGGGLIFLVLRSTGQVAQPEPTSTASPSPTFEQSPTPTTTMTPEPTFTPLPPIEYTIKENDSCLSIAYNYSVTMKASRTSQSAIGLRCIERRSKDPHSAAHTDCISGGYYHFECR
jgi:flagellar basal body-associated protein FliL